MPCDNTGRGGKDAVTSKECQGLMVTTRSWESQGRVLVTRGACERINE